MSDREIREALERIKSNVRELEWLLDQQEAAPQRDLVVDVPALHVSWKGRAVPLTRQQTMIVEHLARRPKVVRTYDDIADAVNNYDCSVDSVYCQIAKIKERFRKVDPDFDKIENVYGAGYRWETG